jgi:hypothetical protein
MIPLQSAALDHSERPGDSVNEGLPAAQPEADAIDFCTLRFLNVIK